MNKYFFKIVMLTAFILSCKQDEKPTGMYEFNGKKIKATIIDNSDSLLTGFGAELYEDGAVKSLAKYIDGAPSDTLFYYFKSGQVQEKGIVENGFRKGWWTYYDINGRIKERVEWVSARDSSYKNQSIYFDNTGDIKKTPSTYFELEISDTIKVGRNLAKVKCYSTNFSDDKNLLTVIVHNQYSENEIQKDTFSDGTMRPFFGVYGHKPGKQLIKGELLETILRYSADSTTLKVMHHSKYFEREVYVWEKDSYSSTGLRIARQMEEEYNEN